VQFNITSINIGGGFNATDNTFYAPVAGWYWMHVDIAITAFSFGLTVLDSLKSYSILTKIVNKDSCLIADIQSMDKLLYLTQGQRCYVNLAIYTQPSPSAKPDTMLDDKVTIAWSLFNIEPTSKPLVAFNVEQTEQEQNNIAKMSVSQTLTFTNVPLNAGDGWNSTSNKFSAPISGVYIFSYHVAGVRWVTVSLVVKNGAQYTIQASIDCFDGVDTASRSVPVRLSQGRVDEVKNMVFDIAD
jgi:hypothetical protein